jgi:radical SAM protein with 4Fe4S-binding SPASM domain
VKEVFAECEAAARAVGINLYLSDFALPNVEVNALRAKVPAPREDHGTCWFVAQYFGVMHTGDVYPCGSQTDFRLGNVLYQDPVEIWNSRAAQRLRARHWSKRGTLFCAGCEYAPGLPARGPAALVRAGRRVRVAVHHLAGKWRRSRDQDRERIFAPGLPPVQVLPFRERPGTGGTRVLDLGFPNEVLTVHPRRGDLWWIGRGVLWRSGSPEEEPVAVAEIPGGRATAFQFLADDRALVASEESGTLDLLELGETLRRTPVLELSDPRSFVRQPTLLVGKEGRIWVGEYGLFPGARCAHVYLGEDGGASFRHHHHVREAKHVHRVAPLDGDSVAVTTGDLPRERRLYRTRPGRGLETLIDRWAGFTSIVAAGEWVHCGTDLPRSNALVRLRPGSAELPELRWLPPELDLQFRQVILLPDGRLVALASMDADLRHACPRAWIGLSSDGGESWTVEHRFGRDWSDVPEEFVVLPGPQGAPVRLVGVCTPRTVLVSLPPGTD